MPSRAAAKPASKGTKTSTSKKSSRPASTPPRRQTATSNRQTALNAVREYEASHDQIDPRAALAQSMAAGDVPRTISAYDLPPAAPFMPKVSDHPVDLGDYDKRFAGCLIVVRLDLPTGVIRNMTAVLNEADQSPQANLERAEAVRRFAEAGCAAWNLTRYDAALRKVVALRQPGEGGVDELPIKDVLQVIVRAINAQYRPDPNS